MTKEVYIVTSGEYSDYSIDAVFTKVKLAKAYVERYGGRIEIHETNPSEKFIKEGISYWTIMMQKNGDIHHVPLVRVPDQNLRENVGFVIRTSNVHPQFSSDLLFSYTLADSEEKAIKIANERRTVILANNLWGKEKEANEILGLKP